MLVLWIIALLTIIAVAMSSAQRTETALTANLLDAARFRAQADAAVAYAALQLMAPPVAELEEGAETWVPDGQPRSWTFAGAELEIVVLNEASLIDLNQAPRELLIGLLAAAEVPEEEQDAIADAILDWRDEDDLHLAAGAEDPDYAAAGLSYGAKDAPFESVEELRDVIGMSRDLYRALAPVLTVAGTGRVDEALAPPMVVAALRGMTVEEAERQLLEEAAGELANPVPAAVKRGGPLYRIRVTRLGNDGARLTMEVLASVQRGAPIPVAVRWRRYGLFADRPEPGGPGNEPPP
jgi:general secretion pathway protein K